MPIDLVFQWQSNQKQRTFLFGLILNSYQIVKFYQMDRIINQIMKYVIENNLCIFNVVIWRFRTVRTAQNSSVYHISIEPNARHNGII